MLLRSMVLLCVLLLGGAASASTILVWGDSLSAGYGLRADQSWPSLLQQRLRERGSDARVVNASISGETSAGGRSRLPAAIERHRPDLLILALGANDGLRGLPLQPMRSNLRAMIDTARGAGAHVLLVGMRLPPNYGPSYATKFQESFSVLAADTGVALLPFLLESVAARREYFQDDGLHPTADAQPLILDSVWRRLEPMLPQR